MQIHHKNRIYGPITLINITKYSPRNNSNIKPTAHYNGSTVSTPEIRGLFNVLKNKKPKQNHGIPHNNNMNEKHMIKLIKAQNLSRKLSCVL